MGIFNEQSDNSFAKGIQGAPGVGFNLTVDGDYDMVNKKIRNVGTPTVNSDAATKKYVDDNATASPTTTRLTVDSNIDMKNRYRITNLITPQDPKDPATKGYVDNTFLDTDGSYPMKGNLNMDNNRIFNLPAPNGGNQPTPLAFTDLKYVARDGSSAMTNNLNMDNKKIINLRPPTSNTDATTKKYVDDAIPDTSSFIKKDGSVVMTGDFNTGGHKILNLRTPTTNSEPATKKYVDDNTGAPDLSDYLEKDGTVAMTGNLNVGNNKIVNLATPTSNTDAANKKYVDDNIGSPDLSSYLKKDGTVTATGNLNVGNNKIINLGKPTQDNDAVNKDYADKLVHKTAVQPSHYNDQFSYLMESGSQWTDEIDSGTSFNLKSIGDLAPNKGNFHNYNHKVIFMGINKNSQGYKYKMGINFYRLTKNTDYTLCFEILNTDYTLWNKTLISVDKGTSTGLSIGNVNVRKLYHRYIDASGTAKFMYYHRIIVNFKKLSTGNRFFLHILVNIPQEGTDLALYPNQFQGVYIITYGIVGTFSNIDPDKVYDYHTAFDIKPTEVTFNVDINANNKKILNINLDKNNNNSAATVGMVNEINTATVGIVNKNLPFIKNYVYRKYFEHFFDFSDSNNYVLNKSSIGVVFNALSSITGNSAQNITFPSKTMDNIKEGGLRINDYKISFKPPIKNTSYTLCIVFSHFKRNNFSIKKYDVSNANSRQQLLFLYYLYMTRALNINIGNVRKNLAIPSSFSGKKIVLWLTESINDNITKVNISNYSADLDANIVRTSANLEFEFSCKDSVIEKFMYSPNFYDIDSSVHHHILLQEKINGNYVL